MIQKLFSIYDTKSGLYSKPFNAHTKGDAIRSFIDIANDSTHPIGKHPEDYILFETGTWDDKTCEHHDIVKESCGSAMEYKNTDEALPPIEKLKRTSEKTSSHKGN